MAKQYIYFKQFGPFKYFSLRALIATSAQNLLIKLLQFTLNNCALVFINNGGPNTVIIIKLKCALGRLPNGYILRKFPILADLAYLADLVDRPWNLGVFLVMLDPPPFVKYLMTI